MFILKHLKTLQHVSIIIQVIFRELVLSLLKSVTLTRNIRAPWRWSEWWSKHVGAFLSVFNMNMYVCMYVYRVQNVFVLCPTPRLHCFLSSHWPSFRFLLFMAFFILSIQFFFGLPRALFCFGIHFNAILETNILLNIKVH